jgi:small redox-active disulfide protein 2
MQIQVLGMGCAACSRLAENAEIAARESGVEYTLEKVSDITRILTFDVIRTPALVIDGKLLCSGNVPTVAEIKTMFIN